MHVLKKVLKIFFICLLLIILIANISIIIQANTNPDKVPGLFGYKPFIVLSGSMESEIHVGDLVIVKEIDARSLKKDDIIAFRDNKNLVTTHRIVEIKDDKDGYPSFITKGDANNANDEEIQASQIEGIYVHRFGKLGNAVLFIQKPLGFAVVVLSIFIVCMLVYIHQNKNINKKIQFADDEERKAFEEFKKSREKNT